MCTPLGAVDAGEAVADTNASVDARMAADAPGPDAPTDAPLAADANADAPIPDAGPVDAFVPTDAAVTCPTYAMTQAVSNVRGCTGVTATTVTILGPGAAPDCAIDLVASGRNIDGTMMLVGGVMTGGISVGMLGYPNCTLTDGMLRGSHTLTCGMCSLTLTDR